jgi:iron-sulfur cluster repair protein YtfE (RIC family)
MTMDISGGSPLIQIKARVQAGHAGLRAMLDDLDRQLAARVAGSTEPSARVRLGDSVWNLFLALDEHLEMEERDLLPHLSEAGGRDAVERIRGEHHEQRTVLLAMVDKCDATTRPMEDVIDNVRSLVGSLRKDMDREDLELDKLDLGPLPADRRIETEQRTG